MRSRERLRPLIRDSGHVLAEGAVSGSAHRYGHAHSPELLKKELIPNDEYVQKRAEILKEM